MVFIHHMEQGFRGHGYLDNYENATKDLGYLGVILFFVLSGFLITLLLLNEKRNTGTISIKNFYLKRVLRIWPLFYILVIFAFFIAPRIEFFSFPSFNIYQDFNLKLFCTAAFLGNAATFLQAVPFAWHLWSISSEEQFYFIWPILLKKFNALRIILITFFIYVSCRYILELLPPIPIVNILKSWLNLFSISAMAIGGALAWLFHQKKFRFFENKIPYILSFNVVLLAFVIYNRINLGFLNLEIYSLLFGLLIFILASSTKIQSLQENKIFYFLGKISFGFYMYHSVTIIIVFRWAQQEGFQSRFLIYICALILTISIATVSYWLIEKRIIDLKKKFIHG